MFQLYGRAVPPEFFEQLRERLNLRARGIYSLAVVVWLMIWQRLDGNGTLASAVLQVVQGVLGDLVPRDKRVIEERVSSNTGGLSRARKRLPPAVAEVVCDQIFSHLMAADQAVGLQRRLFLLDGSSIQLPHTPALVAAYPPASNQYGESHWPVMRVLVGHHLASGLAARPCWGPMYGPRAVSEQGLAEELMERIPPHSVLLYDRNFGVFSLTWKAQQRGHDVLVRLTEPRARKIAGKLVLAVGEYRVEWRPSQEDRRSHPSLPEDAVVRGRLIVAKVERDGKLLKLYLFTTLEDPREQLVQIYARRWDIELDIRSLKQTLRMHSLSSKTPVMIDKELLLATASYNLVRSVQVDAARLVNLEPRQLSFSRVRAVVMTAVPRLASITDAEQWNAEYEKVLRWAAQGKLPKRTTRRSCPRAVWGRRSAFPKRKTNAQGSTTNDKTSM